MATNPVADEARGLPREPTSAWILFLAAGAAVPLAGLVVRVVRMTGAGGRYAEQPGLD